MNANPLYFEPEDYSKADNDAIDSSMSVSKLREMGYDDETISAAMISANLNPDAAFQILLQGEDPQELRVEDELPIHFVPTGPPGSDMGYYEIRVATPASEMIQNNCCLRCLAQTPVLPREQVGLMFKYMIILMTVVIGIIALSVFLAKYF